MTEPTEQVPHIDRELELISGIIRESFFTDAVITATRLAQGSPARRYQLLNEAAVANLAAITDPSEDTVVAPSTLHNSLQVFELLAIEEPDTEKAKYFAELAVRTNQKGGSQQLTQGLIRVAERHVFGLGFRIANQWENLNPTDHIGDVENILAVDEAIKTINSGSHEPSVLARFGSSLEDIALANEQRIGEEASSLTPEQTLILDLALMLTAEDLEDYLGHAREADRIRLLIKSEEIKRDAEKKVDEREISSLLLAGDSKLAKELIHDYYSLVDTEGETTLSLGKHLWQPLAGELLREKNDGELELIPEQRRRAHDIIDALISVGFFSVLDVQHSDAIDEEQRGLGIVIGTLARHDVIDELFKGGADRINPIPVTVLDIATGIRAAYAYEWGKHSYHPQGSEEVFHPMHADMALSEVYDLYDAALKEKIGSTIYPLNQDSPQGALHGMS
jgi:hypothetical protein